MPILACCCLSSLALLPFFLPLDFHDSQRILSILLAAIIVSIRIWRIEWTRHTLGVLLVLAALGITSVSMSPAPLWSGVEFALLFSVFLLPITLFVTVDEKWLQQLAISMVIIQAGYISRDLWNYVEILLNGYPLHAAAVIDGFSNMRFYGQFLIWTMPFSLGVLASSNIKRWRTVFIGVLALSWAMAYLSGTRSFFIAMLGSLILTGWCTPLLWKRYAAWLVGTAFIGLLCYTLLVLWLPDMLSSPAPETLASDSINRDLTDSSGRFAIWIHALQQAWANPWFGIGPMMTAEVSFFKTEAHPHNYLIQWVTEWGIPFTLLLSTFLGYQLWQWQQTIREAPQQRAALALPATASIGAAGVAGLFDGLLVMPISLVYLALIIGVAVRLHTQWTPSITRQRLPYWGSALLLFPTLALAGFTLYQTPYMLETAFTRMGNPRFWADGSIEVTQPFGKIYEMGGASNRYQQVAIQLVVELYPHLHQAHCQLFMGAVPQQAEALPFRETPDISIICEQRRDYLFLDLKRQILTVHTHDLTNHQWQQQILGQGTRFTLPGLPVSLPLEKLFLITPKPP